MMNIGIFGGTFDPVHNGHIYLAKTAVEAVKLDKLIVMPDKLPPHKQASGMVSDKDRFEMCRIAFEDMPCATVSDWEMRQSGKSYSVYTMRHFKELYPKDKLWLVIGSDMLLCFDKWYRYDEILSMASLVCVSRKNDDTTQKLRAFAKYLTDKCGGEIVVTDALPCEVSSTEIRESIKKMRDTSCYFPKKIVQYIYEHKLYK